MRLSFPTSTIGMRWAPVKASVGISSLDSCGLRSKIACYQPVITFPARVEFHLLETPNMFLAHPSQFLFFLLGRQHSRYLVFNSSHSSTNFTRFERTAVSTKFRLCSLLLGFASNLRLSSLSDAGGSGCATLSNLSTGVTSST